MRWLSLCFFLDLFNLFFYVQTRFLLKIRVFIRFSILSRRFVLGISHSFAKPRNTSDDRVLQNEIYVYSGEFHGDFNRILIRRTRTCVWYTQSTYLRCIYFPPFLYPFERRHRHILNVISYG